MIVALLCASILIPAASLVVWVFTERWAWPDLFPQVLSDRAVMESLRRKGELVSLMESSVMISSVVAVLSAAIGILTSRALVLYRFRGKELMSFLTVLPLMVKSHPGQDMKMRPISAPHSNDIMENPPLSSRAGSRGGHKKERPAGGWQERIKEASAAW